MAQFSVDVSALSSRLSELESLNESFRAAVESMAEQETALVSMWEGAARDSFHNAFCSDSVQMANFYNAISCYISSLNEIIAAYSQAEMTNVEIATTRTY